MATDLTKYRCRKCRQFLFDDRCVAPSHGALGPCGERSTLWYLNDENDDFLPSWIQKQINQGSWTKGKILCPKCKGRLGSYDFIAVNMCSCGESNTPNIQICKSRVDVSFDQALSNRISTTVLPRRQMNLNLMLDNDETPLYHERFMFADDVIIPSQESAAAVQDITTLSGTATAEDGRVTQDQVTFTNSHDLLLAGVSHFENDNRDIISQQQQTVTNRPSTDITVQPRTHRSIRRQSDPSMGISNFTMQEKSTQTHESIESVQSCSHAQFRQSVGDTLTGTEFRELQQLCESFEQFDNHQDSVNEFNDLSNTMQTNQVAQTLLSAIPLVLRNDGNRDANDEDSHSVRQMSRRRRKNRLRQLRRRAKKRGRSLDGRSGYSVLQEIDQAEEDQDSSSDSENYALDNHCCPVCLDVYFKPHVCQPCKHIFCDPCLRQLARGNPTITPCPLCREVIRHVKLCKDLDTTVKTYYPVEYVARRKAERGTLNSSYPLPGSPERGFWTSMLFREAPVHNAQRGNQFTGYGVNSMTFPSPNPQDVMMNGFYDVPRGLTLLGVTLWMGICFTVVFMGYAIAVLTSKK